MFVLISGLHIDTKWEDRNKERRFPRSDTVYVMAIALPWCSDEGGCNEVSPYDHFQTMVRLGGGEWPLLVQIRPVSSVCSLFCGLHLTF